MDNVIMHVYPNKLARVCEFIDKREANLDVMRDQLRLLTKKVDQIGVNMGSQKDPMNGTKIFCDTYESGVKAIEEVLELQKAFNESSDAPQEAFVMKNQGVPRKGVPRNSNEGVS
jgi:hypothetical protein